MALTDDSRKTLVPQRHIMVYPLLPRKGKHQLIARNGDMLILQGGEPIGAIGLFILIIPHPDKRPFHEADHRSQDLLLGKPPGTQVLLDPAPQKRKDLSKLV